MVVFLTQFGIPLALICGLIVAVEAGYRLGQQRVRGSEAGKAMETGAIQGAMLGLLGLLLGFSFAGASGRFMERQGLISVEANSISTAFLRADLLDEPFASELRTALAEYTAHRIEASKHLQRGLPTQVESAVEQFHARIWSAARDGVQAKPAVTVAVLGPVNEVIDMHASRVAAGQKHLPGLVLGLLVACSTLTLGVIGYACALARRRNTFMTTVIAVLIGAALWTTIDLDHPRIGLIRLSDAPLRALRLTPPAPGSTPPHVIDSPE